ncbi:hypothetical protein P170DRAFT_434083 [Aspergillus steynii IBT 23096]|uniref:SUN-domain-containing protein n=1 Tax=Aspergillus steynii IBT 23096 TaxID=1392250 RepID=A0A2I2GHH1_9EURO|nr:uncharacterized protein P170DRAFT_434083 [Aspergillus steynii IBT 23096]PLB52287.1 hypothetical protein P170DRAFT_434083 [Aspergillus steynii IBT 23096]
MKFTAATAVLAFLAATEAAQHGHHHNRRHPHSAAECEFPSDAGLVSVTPKMKNAGWAMSPDQPCKPGNYCPYACPPGQVSMQWDPKATSYSYPMSMNGGLYCDEDGQIKKPFPNEPYCKDGTGSVGVRNKCKGGDVSVCQTVLPGNEAMLIPTLVQDLATLAVPDPSYWCETAAHFYINPPGYGPETACVWGTSSNPYGNWSPYVAGANTNSDGSTFLKIGWNPIYLEPATPFRNEVPEFGVEIECEGGGCNGLPCKIDPAVNSVNEMMGDSEKGAGGAAFCVVTVPKGEKAHIVVFDKGGSSGGSDESSSSSSSSSVLASSSTVESTTSFSTSSVVSTTSTSSTSISTSTTISTTSTTSRTYVPPTTTSTTPTPSSTSTSTSTSTSSTPPPPTSTSTFVPTSTPTPTFTPSSSTRTPSSSFVATHSPSGWASYTVKPAVLVETQATAYADSTEQPTTTPVPTSANAESGASSLNLEMSKLGLIVAVVAALWL